MFDSKDKETNRIYNTNIGKTKWTTIQQSEYKEGIAFANSCGRRKCPCRTWLQCSKYNSKVWKDIHPEKFDEELHTWYDISFRIRYEHGDSLGNG